MQNTMLDSTISQLLQDNSSVEYVSPGENPIALPADSVIKESFITEKQYRMCVANLFGFEARIIVTNPKDIKDPRSTWWCLADAGNAIGASRSGRLLGILHRRERDSRIFKNSEIIFDDFKGKESLPLTNRGQTFVSLSGFLEILSKTELSSDKVVDDFQEEIFGRVLPQLAFEGEVDCGKSQSTVVIKDSMGRDNLKSLGGDGEIGLPEISGRRINIEDSRGVPRKRRVQTLSRERQSRCQT